MLLFLQLNLVEMNKIDPNFCQTPYCVAEAKDMLEIVEKESGIYMDGKLILKKPNGEKHSKNFLRESMSGGNSRTMFIRLEEGINSPQK